MRTLMVSLLAIVAIGGVAWFGGHGSAVTPAATFVLPPAAGAGGAAVVAALERAAPAETASSRDDALPVAPPGGEATEPPARRRQEAPAAEAVERRPATRAWTGNIVDLATGSPLEGATVAATTRGRRLGSATTDKAGAFRVSTKSDEAQALEVWVPDGWVVAEDRIPLDGSAAFGGEGFVFFAKRWPPDVAGDVSGRLVSESGAWTAESLPPAGRLVLDLISVDVPRISRRARIETVAGGDGAFELAFLLEDVPHGEYELTLSALSNYRWHPRSMIVSPPAVNVEFLRFDRDATLPLAFRVFDRTSGEPLEDFRTSQIRQTISEENGVFMHAGPLDASSFPVDAPFQWSLWSEGYAPAFGNERSFAIEQGVRVAEVFLDRGWGTRLIVLGRNPTMRPLAGATVLLDGDVAGTTGDAGDLVLFARERPERIEVRYRDWELVNNPLRPGRASAATRGHVTAVMLRAPE